MVAVENVTSVGIVESESKTQWNKKNESSAEEDTSSKSIGVLALVTNRIFRIIH